MYSPSNIFAATWVRWVRLVRTLLLDVSSGSEQSFPEDKHVLFVGCGIPSLVDIIGRRPNLRSCCITNSGCELACPFRPFDVSPGRNVQVRISFHHASYPAASNAFVSGVVPSLFRAFLQDTCSSPQNGEGSRMTTPTSPCTRPKHRHAHPF